MHLRPLADDFTIALDSSTLLVLANRSPTTIHRSLGPPFSCRCNEPNGYRAQPKRGPSG
jgi:hypothetical protein